MGQSKVVVRNLQKRYGDVAAISNVSFDIADGEIFGLLGPNGAGKTTTVETIEGLRQPDAGSVSVCGFDVVEEPLKVKQRIGVQLQSTALPDKIKTREALNLFASFYPDNANLNKLLDLVELSDKAESCFDTLSGGQQQRLAVALALVNNPEIVLLDEPTAGLDPQGRRSLHEVIERLRDVGKTVLLTTHYIEEAERLCDRVAIIDHGRIIALKTPNDLIRQSEGQSRIEFTASGPVPIDEIRSLPNITRAEMEGTRVLAWAKETGAAVVDLVNYLEDHGNKLEQLSIERPSLEDVFIELTGRRLRE